MANVSKEKREQVKELHDHNYDVEYISDLTGIKAKTVRNILGLTEEDEVVKGEEEESEEPEEELESAEYYKAWMEFWKEKYLEEHAKLIQKEAESA